jgi:hypothetical protein
MLESLLGLCRIVREMAEKAHRPAEEGDPEQRPPSGEVYAGKNVQQHEDVEIAVVVADHHGAALRGPIADVELDLGDLAVEEGGDPYVAVQDGQPQLRFASAQQPLDDRGGDGEKIGDEADPEDSQNLKEESLQ